MDTEFNILDFIPIGKENAVSKQSLMMQTGLDERKVRLLIADARMQVTILSLSDGGYFIPDVNNPDDRDELFRFLKREESRLKSIGLHIKTARWLCKEVLNGSNNNN